MEKRIGTIDYFGREASVRIEVELDAAGELHITGSVWLLGRKNDCETCGQIQETLRTAKWVTGPTVDVAKLLAIWDRWHLNHMRAGCEHQRAEKWDERPIDSTKPLNTYGKHCGPNGPATWNMLGWVTKRDHPEGLLSEPCPVCGYKYGTAWQHEALPEEVIAWAREWNTPDHADDERRGSRGR